MIFSTQVETTLLFLKLAFLVLLYLFIWRIVRSAARDLRLPQESMILSPQAAASAGLIPQPTARELGRLVVLASPALAEGDAYSLAAQPLTVGRGNNNDVPLPSDEYASTRHARFEPRRDGVYIEDIGSTNGTFVNGIRLTRDRKLTPGDVVRIGETDSYVVAPPLFAVADGMGGAQAGELASGLAAAAMREADANGSGEQRISDLIQEANRRVHDRASTDASASGMGTTMTVALVEPDGRVVFGHVGDSRAYVLRDNRLDQLTDDHSLVAELVRRGELSPAEAEVHPQRSVITRALGTDPDVDIDTFAVSPQPGDVFLICSDGLSSYVDGDEIERIMVQHRDDLNAGAKALIQAANRGGGDDNITAILFRVEEDGTETAAPEPDEQTRELAALPGDDEDTLHPEDGIAPPPPAEPAPTAVDTMVVSADDIHAAIAEHETSEAPQAGLGRRLLALLVIIALIAVIVALVWWGLAR